MIEKEIKILDINQKEIQKRLKALGAELTFSGTIVDNYYTFPLDSKESLKESIRIRNKWGVFHITFKKKCNAKKIKKCREYEVAIIKPDSVHAILETHGLQQTRQKQKYRYSYMIGKCHFDIDLYPWLPPLLEIEWPSKKAIYTWVDTLWYQDNKIVTRWSKKLFAYYEQLKNPA